MYLLAFCCDHLYSHITIPLIGYPREFEQRFTIIEERSANIKKPWCESRDLSRIQDILRPGVNAHESL